MFLYDVFFKKQPNKIIFFVIIGLVAGLLNSLLFIYINKLITTLILNKPIDYRINVFVFLALIFFGLYTRRFLAYRIIKFTQKKLYELKAELTEKLINASYKQVANRKEEVFNVLTKDVVSISEAGNNITNIITSIIIIITCFVYIFIISFKLFILIFLVILLGIFIYRKNMKNLFFTFEKVRELTNQFIKYTHQIVDGFKEIKVAREKGKDLHHNFIITNLKKHFNLVTRSFTGYINSQYFGELLFNLTVGFILIFGSCLLSVEREAIVSFVFVLLFISGPIQNTILQIPILLEANVSAKRLFDLGVHLDNDNNDTNTRVDKFISIELHNARFKHVSELSEFEIGPINLRIEKGEIIFIQGGNGSGKTTLLLCLLGIYKFDSGNFLINNKQFADYYSSLFTVVFSDFYLFDRFYGNSSFDKNKANQYLKLFELDSKVAITEFGFSEINLSLGQRKRLALIQVLLENKPIIILDEWAADQDPLFRKKFYTEILSVLKNEGRTILAVTHDDSFFNVADKLYKMEYGKLT